jgi:hypothetical protein
LTSNSLLRTHYPPGLWRIVGFGREAEVSAAKVPSCWCAPVAGALAQTEDNLAIFQSRILPVLTQNCGSCHGGSTLRVRRARRCHWAVRWSKEKTTDQPALFAKPRVITASPFSFEKHGHCEMEASELFPNLATCADDLAVVRSRAELQTPQRIKKRKAGVATSKP